MALVMRSSSRASSACGAASGDVLGGEAELGEHGAARRGGAEVVDRRRRRRRSGPSRSSLAASTASVGTPGGSTDCAVVVGPAPRTAPSTASTRPAPNALRRRARRAAPTQSCTSEPVPTSTRSGRVARLVDEHVRAPRRRPSAPRSAVPSSTGDVLAGEDDRASGRRRRCGPATPARSRWRRPGGRHGGRASPASPRAARSAGGSGRPRRGRSSRATRRTRPCTARARRGAPRARM